MLHSDGGSCKGRVGYDAVLVCSEQKGKLATARLSWPIQRQLIRSRILTGASRESLRPERLIASGINVSAMVSLPYAWVGLGGVWLVIQLVLYYPFFDHHQSWLVFSL
jgi:hypothetical protein